MSLRTSGSLRPIEIKAYDHLLTLLTQTNLIDSRIVLISIDEHDFDHWGWPISDALLLEALKTLQQQQPRVIGIDLFRSKPIPRLGRQSTTPDFEALNHFFANNDNIIGIWSEGNEAYPQGQPPAPELAKGKRAGVAGLTQDPDGVIRQGMLYLGNDISFSLLLTLYYLAQDNIQMQPLSSGGEIKIGDSTLLPLLPDRAGDYIETTAYTHQFLLDYQGIKKGFLNYTLTDLLTKKIPAHTLTDKLVIIGITSSIEKDYFYTPWSEDPQANTRHEPGIAIHGYSSSQILRIIKGESTQIQGFETYQEWLWLWLWCIAGSYAALTAPGLLRFIVIVAGGVLVISGAAYLGFIYAWRIPIIPSILGWLLTAIAVIAHQSNQEHQQRIILEQQVSPYIPLPVDNQWWKQRKSLFESNGRLRPQEFTATVLFTDIQGFTTLSEGYSHQPEKLMKWLNTYMKNMVDVVKEHQGIVNKFTGDGLMVVFGIPGHDNSLESIRQKATDAILCALEMERMLSHLNQQWQQQNLPTARIRIGIFTGKVVAGSLGSNDRLEYAVIGDTVNNASHLENYDKSYCHEAPCRIMAGESTLTQIQLPLKKEPVGRVNLKGKQGKIKAYRILGLKP